ncbi:hypothetical protein NPIL_50661 [Nephila pilipes]|uniref:Uncharacterized protein n=1 Tax=Nephila pilipes TaxID=299642 RepID=A0A8X6IAA4_NEPPI|nr:hypothetical protein NPIL_50661 [Nephila pilipes]
MLLCRKGWDKRIRFYDFQRDRRLCEAVSFHSTPHSELKSVALPFILIDKSSFPWRSNEINSRFERVLSFEVLHSLKSGNTIFLIINGMKSTMSEPHQN